MKNKIQIFRGQKNLTQTELAEKSRLSLRTIQRIEAGNIPKGHTLRSLAKALDTEPENLISNTTEHLDLNRAKIINISSLAFLILPFANIILPAILTYKSKEETTKLLGRKVISIQIIWTIFTSILMILSPFLHAVIPIKFPLAIIILAVLICINIFIILKNGISLNQTSDLNTRLSINIL